VENLAQRNPEPPVVTSVEIKDLPREARALKGVVAELILENCLLKKGVTADWEYLA